jgi:hypothetical protein
VVKGVQLSVLCFATAFAWYNVQKKLKYFLVAGAFTDALSSLFGNIENNCQAALHRK